RSSALQVTGTTQATLAAARSRLASAKATLAREQAQLTQDSAAAARAQMVARSGGLAPADVDRAVNAFHAQQAIVVARREDGVAAPETDAAAGAVGDSLDVRLASGETLRGRVISKGAEGEFATQHDVSSSKRDIRAIALRVAIPNPRRTLVPGMTVTVVLPTK